MSSAEFLSTNPLSMDTDDAGDAKAMANARRNIFKLSLHFDPYAPTAEEDYSKLKKELRKFPILDLIKSELTKTRVNIALARKLVKTLQFISDDEIEDAVKTLIENEELLYPIYFNVLSAVRPELKRLSAKGRESVTRYVMGLIDSGAPVLAAR